MILEDLLCFEDIVIQCHDNPDADAIGSGFGLYEYFKSKNKTVRFIYSGKFNLTKSNLLLMVKVLRIPIEYVSELDHEPELLITCDCQYGESNVTRFDAKNVAVIDHHQVSRELPPLSEVKSNLGSCSTIVWKMLDEAGFNLNSNENLATALFYGLMTDTNNFAELHHPLDRDLRDEAKINHVNITLFRNSNLSIDELGIAGRALLNTNYDLEHKSALVESEPCDPNILGIISDMVLEVDKVNTCIVYSILPFGVKLSVRSCVKEVRADEFAGYICREVGNGGGHIVKAGGFLQKELLDRRGITTPEKLRLFLNNRMKDYFDHCSVIYSADYKADITQMVKYKKKHLHLGYVDLAKVFPIGTKLQVRTLEGDIQIIVRDNVYMMVGVNGEIYPQERERFERNYWYSDQKYVFSGEYLPTVKTADDGKSTSLLPYIESCISSGESVVYIKKLDRRIKLFSSWDINHYYLGKAGDYLAVRSDDLSDVYIIADDIFDLTYEKCTD